MNFSRSTMGPVVEVLGLRHFSTAPTAQAPQPVGEARVLHRTPDRRTLTVYESRVAGVEYTQSPASVWETFYVIEGTIGCRSDDGAETVFRTGDLGYRSWEQTNHVRLSDGLRVARFIWSSVPLPPAVGGVTTGPVDARLSTAATENSGLRSIHVFGDQGVETRYHGQPCFNRPIDISPDGRHASFFGFLPDGVTFTEHPADLGETFLMVRGTITCRPRGSDDVIVWSAGDLVHGPYDREIDVEYSAGMGCVCWFWSEDGPLPLEFTP